MSKRFTDSKKWKNEWFQELPLKAKLAWIYLCDECELTGVWKSNYKLASYQLGFPLTQQLLKEWFQDKIHLFDDDKVLIVQFFEFQYAQSKDTWSAKIEAKKKLEMLGFPVVNNKVQTPTIDNSTTVATQSGESVPTPLIRVIVKGKGKVNNVLREELEKIYKENYPRKEGKSEGLDFLVKDLKSDESPEQVRLAILKYNASLKANKTEKQYIKMFSTWAHKWRDWLDDDAGTSTVSSKNYENERDTDHDAELADMWK